MKLHLERHYYKSQYKNSAFRFAYSTFLFLFYIVCELLTFRILELRLKYDDWSRPYQKEILIYSGIPIFIIFSYLGYRIVKYEYRRLKDYGYKYNNYYDLVK